MRRFIFLFALLLLIAEMLLPSCANKPEGNAAENDTVSADTIIIEPEPAITALPDTAFASVEALDYKVDVFDTLHSGVIDDLRDLYKDVTGVLTFRGGPQRDANFHGRVEGTPDTVIVEWAFTTEMEQTWGGGTGWTGQPLYIEWPDSCAAIARGVKEEVMFGSLCGKVYFVDFQTGEATREPIDVVNPIKGTMMLDPAMNGRLYVGQGVPNEQPFGALTIDLHTDSIVRMYGKDYNAWRGWGAYDSSPVRVGQFVFRPGENGTLYKYRVQGDEESLHSTLRFRKKGTWGAGGMEASMAVYANYGYVADNHGNVVCVNLNTMRLVWHYDNKDDNDATPVIGVEDGTPYIYCACEMDRQGMSGTAHFVKLNGLTGEEVWHFAQEVNKCIKYEKHFDGGFYSTALLGEGNCADRVFTNIVLNTDEQQDGCFIALDRTTGEQLYAVELKHYAWSSPVSFLNEREEQFIFTADTYGYVYLIDGKTGNILYRSRIGTNFESSPIVVGNHVVVGSRGNQVFKMKVLSTRNSR